MSSFPAEKKSTGRVPQLMKNGALKDAAGEEELRRQDSIKEWEEGALPNCLN